jgi:hypothetical protein
MSFASLTLIAALAAVAPPAGARPSEISAIASCRTISDAAQRLACYDGAAQRLEQAISSKELTVLSRSDVRRTRRSLFGFGFPNIPFLSGGGEEADKQITAKIARLRSLGYGKWQFTLDDGAVWETTESSPTDDVPSTGQNVTIKRGALSNYFILFQNMRAVRGRRVS